MTLDLRNDVLPLSADESGTIRVSGTRVTLDVILGYYKQGMSPEEIARAFPTVPIADIYAVIAYYLRRREQVDQYLADREREAAELRQKIEASQPPAPRLDELRTRRDQLKRRA